MRKDFSVTYEIVTDESASEGEAADSGFVGEGLTLREALAECRGYGDSAIECDSSHGRPRWINFYSSPDMYSGEFENRALHIPDSVSDSSAVRIARYLGAR